MFWDINPVLVVWETIDYGDTFRDRESGDLFTDSFLNLFVRQDCLLQNSEYTLDEFLIIQLCSFSCHLDELRGGEECGWFFLLRVLRGKLVSS